MSILTGNIVVQSQPTILVTGNRTNVAYFLFNGGNCGTVNYRIPRDELFHPWSVEPPVIPTEQQRRYELNKYIKDKIHKVKQADRQNRIINNRSFHHRQFTY